MYIELTKEEIVDIIKAYMRTIYDATGVFEKVVTRFFPNMNDDERDHLYEFFQRNYAKFFESRDCAEFTVERKAFNKMMSLLNRYNRALVSYGDPSDLTKRGRSKLKTRKCYKHDGVFYTCDTHEVIKDEWIVGVKWDEPKKIS